MVEPSPDQERVPKVDEREEQIKARARAWAKRLPRMSDEQWRSINAGLGYRVRERKKGEKG